MKILVSGATGLIGRALFSRLRSEEHVVSILSREESKLGAKRILWDPMNNRLDRAELEGFDAVVHLAGRNIAQGRWNEAVKQEIYDSRVRGTQLLSTALSEIANPPRVLVSASAIGYYGAQRTEELSEASEAGSGFLAEVCRAWEKSTAAAETRGIRVVHSRFGLVLSPEGGALKQMLIPFRLGLGGKIGTGSQYLSWVSLDDVCSAILHLINTDTLRGPVNVVSPTPVTNVEFTRVLSWAVKRPAFLSVPAGVLRFLLGEMADELLLTNLRVLPKLLGETGFNFKHAELEHTLRQLLSG